MEKVKVSVSLNFSIKTNHNKIMKLAKELEDENPVVTYTGDLYEELEKHIKVMFEDKVVENFDFDFEYIIE